MKPILIQSQPSPLLTEAPSTSKPIKDKENPALTTEDLYCPMRGFPGLQTYPKQLTTIIWLSSEQYHQFVWVIYKRNQDNHNNQSCEQTKVLGARDYGGCVREVWAKKPIGYASPTQSKPLQLPWGAHPGDPSLVCYLPVVPVSAPKTLCLGYLLITCQFLLQVSQEVLLSITNGLCFLFLFPEFLVTWILLFWISWGKKSNKKPFSWNSSAIFKLGYLGLNPL